MIDSQIFRVCRERARDSLPIEVARNSFGYYIDVPNTWESYYSPEELATFLGIHFTHAAHFDQIRNDLGPLSGAEKKWIREYVGIINSVEKLLTTTAGRPNLKYDLAETIYDWRTILKFVNLPCRILDYGAGCGRQGISAFLHHRDNIYTAIDSTLAAYTVQNLVFSYLDTLVERQSFRELLDFQFNGDALPKVSEAKLGDRFHIPAWLGEANMPERYFDLIIAAHVHNELSRDDFLRLVYAIDKGLADDGVVYVRSEQYYTDARDFFDSVDLHGLGMTNVLSEKGLVPVYCKTECAYLTVVYARNGSHWHKKAKGMKDPDYGFHEFNNVSDQGFKAGQNYVCRHLQQTADLRLRTVIIGDPGSFHDSFKKCAKEIRKPLLLSEQEVNAMGDDELRKILLEFNPQNVIISSHSCGAMEGRIRNLLQQQIEFRLRCHYWYPIVFLFTDMIGRPDPVFDQDIHVLADLAK
jgi:hypothetical protein